MSMGSTEAGMVRGVAREAASPILASVTFVIELAVVPMLLAAMRQDIGLGLVEIAWVYNIYGLAVAGAVLLGGWLGDRIDPRLVFSGGVLFFAVGAGTCAAAESLEVLLIGRFVQGLGGGIFSPLVPVLLTAISRARPGRILILWGGITGYVAAGLPFLAGEVLADLGWRTIYAAVTALAAVSLMLSLWLSPLPRGTAQPLSMHRRLVALVQPGLLWCYLYIACTYGIVFFILFDLPQRVESASQAGLLLSLLWLSFAIASTAFRNQVDGPRVGWFILLAPLALGAASVLLIADTPALAYIGAPLLGIGFAMGNAPSTQLVLRYAPLEARSLAASLDITVARVGGVAVVGGLASAAVAVSSGVLCTLAIVAFVAGALASGVLHRGQTGE